MDQSSLEIGMSSKILGKIFHSVWMCFGWHFDILDVDFEVYTFNIVLFIYILLKFINIFINILN